jgi:hypothetical protein
VGKSTGYSDARGNGLKPTESEQRLNQLIDEYRQENERCTSKINELKSRLQSHQGSQLKNSKLSPRTSQTRSSGKGYRHMDESGNAEGAVYGQSPGKRQSVSRSPGGNQGYSAYNQALRKSVGGGDGSRRR